MTVHLIVFIAICWYSIPDSSFYSIAVLGCGILLEESVGKKLRGDYFQRAMVLARHFLGLRL